MCGDKTHHQPRADHAHNCFRSRALGQTFGVPGIGVSGRVHRGLVNGGGDDSLNLPGEGQINRRVDTFARDLSCCRADLADRKGKGIG